MVPRRHVIARQGAPSSMFSAAMDVVPKTAVVRGRPAARRDGPDHRRHGRGEHLLGAWDADGPGEPAGGERPAQRGAPYPASTASSPPKRTPAAMTRSSSAGAISGWVQ